MKSPQQYRESTGKFTRTKCQARKSKELNKADKNMIFILLLSLLTMNIIGAAMINYNRVHLSHKQQNKLVHILQGNRNSKGYKLCQWKLWQCLP